MICRIISNENGDRKREVNALKCNGNHRTYSSINYIKNPYINEEDDVLFHLTLSNKTHDLEAMFHDVKVGDIFS